MTTSNEGLNLLPVSLQAKSIKERIEELLNFIKDAPKNSIISSSELCISGYDFKGLDKNFNENLIQNLQRALEENKFLTFTYLGNEHKKSDTLNQKSYNQFTFLSQDGIIYTQPKCKLFKPNLEDKKFDKGNERTIGHSYFQGIKFGTLICFELRFSELWAKLKECEIIFVPAMWGKERKDAYISLCKALAIANNCFVVASSSLDLEFAGVFMPTGELKNKAKFDRNLIIKIKENLGIL
ncbi:carbon-nitrogen hydrolase family protein [Campylobacter sp. RM16187]|uniref:carbon-nitrogen hydrolase family protein n=1 Tax=Campylobacter sp. RM16187 TaxID=1660063 RepID=UPI0021B5803C|nr:carbon-nitrogen hydrolase family protein [Campylobacter sp. RM16187]QKG30233.1 hydrolase, carbon-nitrogen family [Campylobacter sp. RM16187]